MLPRSDRFVFAYDLSVGKKTELAAQLPEGKRGTIFIYLFLFLEASGPELEALTEAILKI